jgi:hypothetical protein
MSKKLTIEELLDWAKEVGIYIEIFGGGDAEIRLPPMFNRFYWGNDLREALMKARRAVQRHPEWLQ